MVHILGAIDDHPQPLSQNKSLYKNIYKKGSATVIAVEDLRDFCRINCVKYSPLFDEFEVSMQFVSADKTRDTVKTITIQ